MAQGLARRQRAIVAAPKVVQITARGTAAEHDGQISLPLLAPESPNLSETDHIEAQRRYEVIEPLVNPGRYPLLTAKPAADVVAFLSKTHKVGARTLYRWHSAFRQGGMAALVKRDRADKGKPKAFGPADLELIVRAALPQRGVYGVLSVSDIYRLHTEEREWRAAHVGKKLGDFELVKYARYVDEEGRLRPEAQLTEASYRTFCRWFQRIPEAARILARDGEEAFRNTQDVLSWRDYESLQPLDIVVMDHRRLDIFCLVPEQRGGWKLARPWITAAIDMRTRKWLGWVIVENPSSDSIAAVLKQIFIRHGLPKECYWDNGKDFRCEWLEGKQSREEERSKVGELGASWRGVMDTLGIRVRHAIVHNARAKLIEPNFGRIADFDRTLPQWCGHKPGARPEHYETLIEQHEQWAAGTRESTPFQTIAQVADLYGRAINDLNERPLQGEGMRKITPDGKVAWWCPNEAWEILVRRVERKQVDLTTLQFCFAKRTQLTVRNSEVRMTFGGQPRHYRIKGEPLQLAALNGHTVTVAYDPMDLGEVVIYDEHSRLVGLAECVQFRRMGEEAFVQDERDRRAFRREVKTLVAQVHKHVPIATPEERLLRRAEVMPSREEPARPMIAAAVPAAIEAAAARRRADEGFRFADATADVATAPAPAEDDSEFHFFRGD